MRSVAIITARWGSTRLPGKMLADLGGKPLLQHIVDRARLSRVDDVWVSTTTSSKPIIKYCENNDIPHSISLDEDDILGRLYATARCAEADIVVRLWGDAPLISEYHINAALLIFGGNGTGYLAASWNEGVVAVMEMDNLTAAHHSITNKEDRHWIHKYMSQPLTVDTQEDLDRVREIVKRSARPAMG